MGIGDDPPCSISSHWVDQNARLFVTKESGQDEILQIKVQNFLIKKEKKALFVMKKER